MKKQVAIAVGNAVQFYSTKPFYDALRSSFITCEFVVPDWCREEFRDAGWWDMQQGLFKVLDEAAVDYSSGTSGAEYDVVLSPYYSWWEPKSKYRVQYHYGYLSLPSFQLPPESCSGYDVLLAYGDFDGEYLSAYAKTCVIGDVKFIDFEKEKKNTIGKPVVLYAPSYGEKSAISEVAPYLRDCVGEYDIIVKAHHGTSFLVDERPELNELQQLKCEVYDASTPIADLLHKADIVLSDNSGVIYDAMAAGVPVVRCAPSTPESFGGIEPVYARLSREGVIPFSTKGKDIASLLKQALDGDIYVRQQQEIERLYADPKKGLVRFVDLIKAMVSGKFETGYCGLHRKLSESINLGVELQQADKENREKIEASTQKIQSLESVLVKSNEENSRLLILLQDKEALNKDLETSIQQLTNEKEAMRADIESVIKEANEASNSRPYRIAYYLYRWQNQWLRGSKADRKAFNEWLIAKIRRRKDDTDDAYNPLKEIIRICRDSKLR